MEEKSGSTITISRQMGSGGSYVGYLIAKELGIKYVDREILRQAAEHLGTETRLLEEQDERSSTFIDNLIRGFAFGAPETAYIPAVKRPFYDRDLFSLECRIMKQIADRYSAVIAGRGGFYALKDRPGVISLFFHAPLEFRVKRVMQVQNITDVREAQAKVVKSDRRRAKFVRDMTGVRWTDAQNYHLCIDSAAVGFKASAEMIIALVHAKQQSGPG